ncbi:two-component system sensor histidine kinase NtrB [Marinicauda salina]|uniref:two-component system sensor histidine kinase NtrB n=1 Tax=Marinicauda salina TaxID=2135793 RepID=UPI0013049E33|nr:ATP-binding protein [Marinicauda salina]
MSEAGRDPAERAAQAAATALVLIDARGRILFANPAAETVLERSRARLEGHALVDAGAAGEAAWRLAERAIAEGREVLGHDVTIETADGPRRAAIDAAPEGEGAVVGLRLWPEAGVSARGDRAASAAAGFGRMLSHELKNPIAGARGAAQLIASSDDVETRELAEVIVGELDRARRIADRWSAVGDIAPAPFGPVNLNELAREARGSAAMAAGEVVSFVERFDPSLPPAFGDRDLLLQALLNLLTNAAESVADAGGGTVEIVTRYRSATPAGAPPDARLEIAVLDDGAGVPDDLGDAVFNPFVTGKPAGEGLGLAIVARVAELHEGGVEYESRPGRTVFHLYLREDASGR